MSLPDPFIGIPAEIISSDKGHIQEVKLSNKHFARALVVYNEIDDAERDYVRKWHPIE